MLPHDYLTEKVREAGELCHSKNLPFMLTEWSSSYSSRDAVHDHYFNAPFILHAVKRCEGRAEMMSYWVYTDIFEEVKPPLKMFHGGFGLLTVQSVPKPSYHAFRFLSQLGERELYCDDKES